MQIHNVQDRNYMPRQAKDAVQSRVDRIWLTELTGGKEELCSVSVGNSLNT